MAVRPLLFVVAALTIEAAMAAGAADSRTALSVAVVRRDGILIPFAAFNGKRWSNAWPPPKADLQVPISLASVPKGWWGPTPPVTEWQLWPVPSDRPGAADPRTIRATQPDWVDAHCARQVGLRTDYRGPEPIPPPQEQPYPKDGLAVSPPQAIERIEIVRTGDERDAVISALRARFNRAELETVADFGHPVPKDKREAFAPELERLYAFGEAPRLFYAEASRGYQLGDKCAVSYGTGWFVRDGASMKPLDMAVDLLRCDKYGATYMLPLGALRLGGRTFWIVQYSGWDHERYVVVEVKKNRVDAMVNTWGGGC
jgi:hypothetical protein